MRLLVFTTLFPHPGVPHHGIFVRERLRHWMGRHGGEALVIAPVPWLPRALARGRYAAWRDVPAEERQDGLRVVHPRYALLPKIGMSTAPLSLARAGLRCARRLQREGERFDLVDAHYLYPDCVAAAFVARELALPLVVTARGTDVNLIPRHALPRRWLRWMLRRAAAGIAVADALRDPMRALAPDGLAIETLRNGVDLARFRPLPRGEARRALRWSEDARIVLAVGHLVERKGAHHLLRALPELAGDVIVKLIGEGEERARLEALARELGVAARVELCGPMAHERLHLAYSAADVLALLSAREGWPNVLLESLACGTPVLATRVSGTPEVVREPSLGTLLDSTAPEVVAAAVKDLLSAPRDRSRLRAFAEEHDWSATADGMQRLFERVTAGSGGGGRARGGGA